MGAGFRVLGIGFRIPGLRFRVVRFLVLRRTSTASAKSSRTISPCTAKIMQMTGTWPRDRHATRKPIMNAADSARVRKDRHLEGCAQDRQRSKGREEREARKGREERGGSVSNLGFRVQGSGVMIKRET